ncbi:MAG: YdcH family protein [Burkholderiales bacterium]
MAKSLTDEELAVLQREIESLKLEHRDLDDIINRLALQAGQDQLQLQRLKKRKLHLKDLISQLETQTVPDISA